MSRTILFSTLGLTGFLGALAAQACSNSSSTPPPANIDSGATEDTGATTGPSDSGPAEDTGTPQTGTDSGTTTPVDAGPWTPSNFTLSDISAVTPIAIDENDDCTASTSDGTWSCGGSSVPTAPPSVPVTLSGAGGTATLWVMSSFTLETGNTLTISGTKPAIFYVSGAVLINDAVVVESGELTAGVGVGGAGDNASSTPLSGGGGGSYCGLGGVGFPVPDAGPAAAAGVAYGVATLIPLVGGSAGGATGYNGGSGGGALQITSGTSITIVAGGSILAGGNVDSNANYTTAVNGSGGGSGGAILLEAPSVAIAGNVSANGGSGADNQDYGNPATTSASPALGGGTGGGAGSYGSVLNGGPGTGGTGGIYAGAGGGGAGYIRINTSNGTIGGIITPSVDAGCTTLGAL